MRHINLLEITDIYEKLEDNPEWKAFWDSLVKLLNKSEPNSRTAKIFYPCFIIFEIEKNDKTSYAWKIIPAWSTEVEVDIYKWLLESNNLLFLLADLTRSYLYWYDETLKNLSFPEIALLLSDRKVVVSEAIRVNLLKVFSNLEQLIPEKYYESI